MKTVNWLSEFVKWAVTLDADASAKLTPNERNQIIETLEKCASHRRLLKQYLAALQLTLDGNVRYNGFLTIAQADRVASEGLAVLENGDLVRIALDPVSMWTLHEAVHENVSERWANRIVEADEELLNLGLVNEEVSQPTRTGFPWDKLELVSPQSLSALLGVGDVATLPFPANDTRLPGARAAAGLKRLPSPTRSLPTAQAAASQKQLIPNATCSPALGVIRKHGAPFTFLWLGAQYTLSADADAIVYVDAPSAVTHLKVGETDLYPLQSTDIEGRFLVSGVKRPHLRRRIEAGETVTFWSQDTEDE